jgi:hypothetical protein
MRELHSGAALLRPAASTAATLSPACSQADPPPPPASVTAGVERGPAGDEGHMNVRGSAILDKQ